MSNEDEGEASMPPGWNPTMALKRVVRAQVKEALEKLSRSHIEYESNRIAQNVLNSSAYKNSKSLACYLTMDKYPEVHTRKIVEDALESGRRVYVPRVNRDRLAPKNSKAANKMPNAGKITWMSMLRLYSLDDMNNLKLNAWGIPEPHPDDGPEGRREDLAHFLTPNVDLIIMPGVAFDSNLSRLGHGAGYYDKWLAQYAATHGQGTRPILMGLALSEQVVSQIPVEPHDWPLDMLVTPDGILPE